MPDRILVINPNSTGRRADPGRRRDGDRPRPPRMGTKLALSTSLRRGKTLTRLAALGTLSRDAGEGLQRIQLEASLPHRGRGGTKTEGLGG